jgi:hypothetical protein
VPAPGRQKTNLILDGQTFTVAVEVPKEGGHYVVIFAFQADRVRHSAGQSCGGSIRVKDEMQIEFNIQLAR